MKIIEKTVLRMTVIAALLIAGFAAGFPIGQSVGFSTGSEWAIVQADLVARESGLLMPITYEGGKFRVIVKQPRHLYRRAWQLAERHDTAMDYVNTGAKPLSETIRLTSNTTYMTHMTQ
ncbi:MAG TPA: hypothetical protein VEI57_19155 [Nitrospirota bacterium]|nr:hypothetical protein [Nitrospirota bacterium]